MRPCAVYVAIWQKSFYHQKQEDPMAVKDCIEHNILKDFLETHATEVMNMLITEWNWDDAFAVQREEGREEGRKESWEEGVKRLRKYGMPPEQIAEALELPLDTVYAYLKAEG
jgi:predicted transposase YdaD